MTIPANPRLKSEDMVKDVFFDSLANRTGAVGANAFSLLTRLQFTYPNAGIQYSSPPGADFPFLNFGNTDGLQVLSVGKQQIAAVGPVPGAYSNFFPVGRGSSKVYSNVGGSANIIITDESSGAVINPAFALGIGTVVTGVSSPLGTKVIWTGSAGVAIHDTATDTVTILSANSYGPVCIADDESYFLAYNNSLFRVELWTGAGVLTAFYLVPAGADLTAGSLVNRLALENGGVNGYVSYTDGSSSYVAKFNATTGVVSSTLNLGFTADFDNPQIVLAPLISRLVARWFAGSQVSLVDTTGVMSLAASKGNFPYQKTTGGVTINITQQWSLTLNNQRNTVYLAGWADYSGLFTAMSLTVGPLEILRQISLASNPFQSRISSLNAVLGVLSSGDDRLFIGNNSFSVNELYIASTIPNKVRMDYIEPLNKSGLFVNGSLAVSEYAALYANQIFPAGGNYRNISGLREGTVSIPRLTIGQVFGGATFGVNNGSDQFRFQGPTTFSGSSLTVFPNAVFNGRITCFDRVFASNGFLGGSSLLPAIFPKGLNLVDRLDAQGQLISDSVSALTLQGAGTGIQLLSHLDTAEDLEVTLASSLAGGDPADRGIVLKSNDGTRYRVTVANGGALRTDPA